MVVFEIGSLLHRMAGPAHLGHPYSQFNARLTRENIVCDVTIGTGGRVFLPLRQRLGMSPLLVTLVFLGMTFLTFLIVEKKSRNSAQEFWVRVFDTLFFNI